MNSGQQSLERLRIIKLIGACQLPLLKGFLGILCIGWLSRQASADTAAAKIRALTQAHTRIVWCQDMGAGNDVTAQATNLRLMGLDTEDERGERVILEQLGNYAKPMLTPSGNRVIFSDRHERQIYLVNWDGSGLKRLASGFALGVWRDPRSGREWVYSGTSLADSAALYPIARAPIDNPDQVEPVWNATAVEADNFQISRDGRWACGGFPWPACGIADLANGQWKKYGEGCWPSLAPDESGLLWIFDGAHRNLTFFRVNSNERWIVPINQAPGLGDYEVYHPRWSNNSRFMTMSGPYKLGGAENRIRGGGGEVEIFLGKFDPHFQSITSWARITHNARADFFPDAWIAVTTAEQQPAVREAWPAAPAQPAAAESQNTWPGIAPGLAFIWENRAGKNEIPGTPERFGRVCRTQPVGAARYGRYFDMDLAQGIFSTPTECSQAILAACQHSDQFSLEALIMPRSNAPRLARAQIIAFTAGATGNFILSQEKDRLVLRLNTSAAAGLNPPLTLGELSADTAQHIIISYAPGQLACFLNGKPQELTNALTGDLQSWVPGDLIFGDQNIFWPGTIDHIAIYGQTLSPAQAQAKFASLAAKLKSRRAPAQLILEGHLVEATPIPAPTSIAPYKRALTINSYDNLKIIAGQYSARQVLVARWAILDGQILATAQQGTGKVYRLVLESFDEHPELESERLIMDNADFLLPLYYEVE